MATPFTTYKHIILYMLRNAEGTLTNSQISEFILDKEYTNYFHLQQAISELETSDLVEKNTIENSSHYQITEEGIVTLSYFENELSEDIKQEVRDYLLKVGSKKPEKIITSADYYKVSPNRYSIRCQILENGTSMLDVTLSAPTEEAAKEISKNWKRKYQAIYENLLEELL